MATSIFCCSDIQPYRPQHLDHEQKFHAILAWARFPKTSAASGDANVIAETNPLYAAQIVRQVNYGPLESKRYFIAVGGKGDEEEPFKEVTERDLVEANYEKLNSCVPCLLLFGSLIREIVFGYDVTDMKSQIQELQVRRA